MGKYEELKNKRVIITGGASGIGQATAKRFVDEGARVFIFDINEEAMAQTRKLIPNLSGAIYADVSNEESVKAGFAAVDAAVGGLDILISNAGISIRNLFADIDFTQWRKVMGINLDGMFLCCKEAIVRMKKQKSGVILLTASTNGMEGHPYYTDYNVSKSGVIMLAKTVALEYAPWLRINSISPGYVLTPMQKAEYTEEELAVVNDGIPMKRHADPSEVAALFAFLSSDDAKYISGVNVPLDGGETAGQYLHIDEA